MSRGRIVQSARSRRTNGSVPSPVIATSMISPMIEVSGPIWGSTFAGSFPRTNTRRSPTC